jgi:hypothetical protein
MMPVRYLSTNINSCPMSVSCTWSFVKPRTVILSIAINLCRSLMNIARGCAANSGSFKKPHFQLRGYWYLTRVGPR